MIIPDKPSAADKIQEPSLQITRRCERRITARRSLIVLAAPAMARAVLAVSSMAALILSASARAVAYGAMPLDGRRICDADSKASYASC
jgi:hypothetical protein